LESLLAAFENMLRRTFRRKSAMMAIARKPSRMAYSSDPSSALGRRCGPP
jgi:hypothetical protein